MPDLPKRGEVSEIISNPTSIVASQQLARRGSGGFDLKTGSKSRVVGLPRGSLGILRDLRQVLIGRLDQLYCETFESRLDRVGSSFGTNPNA